MREISGNIWHLYDRGHWLVVTTNGFVRKNKTCVMGRGIALQAARRFPDLPGELGQRILDGGNHVEVFPQYRIITMPVKHNWWERADLVLIERSAQEVRKTNIHAHNNVASVRPGCGNGGLKWCDVKPVLEKYWNERFVIVEWEAPSRRENALLVKPQPKSVQVRGTERLWEI